MLKRTFLSILVLSQVVLAQTTAPKTEKVWTEQEIKQLKLGWQAENRQQAENLSKQRHVYALLDSLLQGSRLSENTLNLAQSLLPQLEYYPLKMDIEWKLLRAASLANSKSVNDVLAFIDKYPNAVYQKAAAQLPFAMFYAQKQDAELIAYAKKTSPESVDAQCQLFAAYYNSLSAKFEKEQSESVNAEMQDLLTQFDNFWLEKSYVTGKRVLPESCDHILSYWKEKGLFNDEKIQQKAVRLAEKNANNGLKLLSTDINNPELKSWIDAVDKLLSNPKDLENFIENQSVNPFNKRLVLLMFPQWVKTIPENVSLPAFNQFEKWIEKWQLSETEINSWKIAFIQRLFDHTDEAFKTWRDQHIVALKNDALTERRLRMAIWQKTELNSWLALLSSEAKEKAEWRYWLAKSEADPKKRNEIWQKLATERGFYPMLAAQQLSKNYQVTIPTVEPLTEQQQQKWRVELARVAEFKSIQRHDNALNEWGALLKKASFDEQLGLSDYAQKQGWFDLAVEATIQAKAWDYLSLRLPNAYSEWFDLHLTNKNISKSFAMAIARQESAWNSQARSHANAMGLMQLLGSTAKMTAENQQLPYSNEKELFEPFNNIMLGTAHLSELNEKYPNNRILIAAAYNAGASRVEKWLERAGKTLEMDEFIASIPFVETRGYVQNVLAYDYYYQVLQKNAALMMFSNAELQKY